MHPETCPDLTHHSWPGWNTASGSLVAQRRKSLKPMRASFGTHVAFTKATTTHDTTLAKGQHHVSITIQAHQRTHLVYIHGLLRHAVDRLQPREHLSEQHRSVLRHHRAHLLLLGARIHSAPHPKQCSLISLTHNETCLITWALPAGRPSPWAGRRHL